MGRVLSEGDVVGGVRLERRVALGGMAEIWAGREGQALVAVKVMLEAFSGDATLRGMFHDEANIAERLLHENVVRVYRHFEEEGLLGQVMELVDGRDLRRLLQAALKARKPMPPALALFIGRSVAAGLHHAHSLLGSDGRPLEVVHRDVTPHNVLIDRRGGVRVLDFGVARARERITRTQAGVIKGKIAYMAPEQILGRKVGPQSDIFSLGVVLWETVALRRLFTGSDVDIVNQICGEDVPPLSDLMDVEEPVSALIDHMLAPNPADRPASMQAVVEEIDRLSAELWPQGESGPGPLAVWAAPFFEPVKRATARLPEERASPIPPATTHSTDAERPEEATQPGGAHFLDQTPVSAPRSDPPGPTVKLPERGPDAQAFDDGARDAPPEPPPQRSAEVASVLDPSPVRFDSLARALPQVPLRLTAPPAPPRAKRSSSLAPLLVGAGVTLALSLALLWRLLGAR